MEVIVVKSRFRRFLNTILYSALGRLLFILPFFLLYRESNYLLWIFLAEIIVLIGLYNFQDGTDDTLKDLYYVEYFHRDSKYKISQKLKDIIDDEHSIPSKIVEYTFIKPISFRAIVKILAEDPKKGTICYGEGIITISKRSYMLQFIRENEDHILCVLYHVLAQERDISALRKANDEARSLAILYGSLLRHLPVAIVSRNMSLDIIYYNQQYYDLVIGPEGEFKKDDLDIKPEYKKSAMEALVSDKVVVSERSMVIKDRKELFQITDILDTDSGIVTSYYIIRTAFKD